MYLLDTNIILEGLLQQERSDEVRNFLESTPIEYLFLSDFSLHSIGIILFGFNKHELFIAFFRDMVLDGVTVLTLSPTELSQLEKYAQSFNLDFDDAYQYMVSEKYDLTLISYDQDFSHTGRRAKTPSDVLS